MHNRFKRSGTHQHFRECCQLAVKCARYMFSSSPTRKDGVWLNVLIISSLSLHVNNNTVNVVVGLCLCTLLCMYVPNVELKLAERQHIAKAAESGGCYHHNESLNDIIHSVLSSTHVPFYKYPTCIFYSDGKYLDGIPLILWKNGRLLAKYLDT